MEDGRLGGRTTVGPRAVQQQQASQLVSLSTTRGHELVSSAETRPTVTTPVAQPLSLTTPGPPSHKGSRIKARHLNWLPGTAGRPFSRYQSIASCPVAIKSPSLCSN